MPGSPIRTPWDHSSVDSSPRPIAASHVLHRLLVPRHPPFALDNLTTKMLASTVQFSTNDQPTTHQATPNQKPQPLKAQDPAVCRPGHAWQTPPHPAPPPTRDDRGSTAQKNNPPPAPAAQPQTGGHTRTRECVCF